MERATIGDNTGRYKIRKEEWKLEHGEDRL